MGTILVLATNMGPEVLIAVFSLDRFPGLPLLLRHTLEMLVAVLIQTVIRDKPGFFDHSKLPHRNHREILDIQIDRHRDQIGVLLALHDLFGRNRFALQKVDGSVFGAQDQFGTLHFPGVIGPPLFEIAIVQGRICSQTHADPS